MSAARTSDVPRMGSWTAGLLAVAGTSALLLLLSPGLRSDVGGLWSLLGGMDASAIRDWVLSFGVFSPVVYFAVVVFQVIAAPIPAAPAILAGALIFGFWEGLALSLAGSVFGSILVFAAVRRWGEPMVARLVGEEEFRKHVGRLDGKGWWLFVVLLVPLMPDDAVCALAGLSTLTFRRFLLVMIVGRLPGTATTALLASGWVTGSTAAWVSVAVVVFALLAVGLAYRGRLESWLFRRAAGGSEDGSGRWSG